LAVPATLDPVSGKFFAALDAPGSDPALVAWGDGDPVASLDALITGSTARLVGGVTALVPAGNVQGGGVLAVDGAGAVRWFGADARKLAASAGEKNAGDAAVEAATRETGGGGVLVVTRAKKDGAKSGKSKKKDAGVDEETLNARVATLYRAAGTDDAGRSVECVWRVEARPPAICFASDGDTDGNAASVAPRVIAAAAEGGALTLVWSSGVWASYDPHAEDPGAPVRALRLGGGGAALKKPGGKRGAAARGEASDSGALPHASAASLGGGYFAIARARAGGASVTVLDARFGGVHAHRNVDAAGGDVPDGVSVAALADADDGSFRVALCLADAVTLVELPAPPPVSLAVALGALSADERGAAARALGRAAAAAAAAPPRAGVATLELEALLASVGGHVPVAADGEKSAFSFGSGAVVEVDLAGLSLDGDDDADAVDALAAFAREDVTAADAAAALAPFARGEGRRRSRSKSKSAKGGAGKNSPANDAGSPPPMPPAVLSAALDACVRNRLWGPLRELVDAGLVTSSTAAPGMVRALLDADRLEDVEAFVSSAADVSAEDLRLCLDAILATPETCAFAASPASLAASRERRVAAAESAVAAAEALAKRESEKGEKTPRELRAAARDARVAAAAVESFDAKVMPWAFALHAVVSRPIDPIAAADALPSLSAEAAAKLASFASAWLEAYADLAASCDVSGVSAPVGVPSLPTLVGWTSALIDAHFTSFAVEGSMGGPDGDEGGEGDAAAAAAAMRSAAERLSAACDAVSKMGGALAHVAEGAAVPEHQGVLSTTYSIEVVDW
jgi:hypothetical protein